MAVTAEMIDAMVAAGIGPEQILVVVRSELAREHVAAGEAERARIEANREGNRVRQAAYRARRNARNGDVTQSNANNGSNGVTPPKRSPTPPKNTPPEDSPSDPKGSSAPKGADRQRGTRIPVDFGLRPDARQACLDAGLTGRAIDEALAEFQDFWVGVPGVRGMKLDWLATLRNRLRETVRRSPHPRDGPSPSRPAGNGLSQLAERKAHGDGSVYRDPFEQYDRPRRGTGPADVGEREDEGRGAACDDPADTGGRVLSFGGARAVGR